MTLRRSNSAALSSGPDFENLSSGDIFGEIEFFESLISPTSHNDNELKEEQLVNIVSPRLAKFFFNKIKLMRNIEDITQICL